MAEPRNGRGAVSPTPQAEHADAGEHLGTSPIVGQSERDVQPLLVSATMAARLAGIATSSWWKLCAAGRTPAPLRLGRSTRWNRQELSAWIDAGAPSRERWEARKERAR